MIRETMEIGVLVDCRKLKNPWIDRAWVPSAVLAGAPAAAPWTVLDDTAQATRFYAGRFQLEFFSTDTGNYRDNLRSALPCLWISLRPSAAPPGIALQTVTADPSEAEALTEPGTDIIEAVPMPQAVQARLAAFVEAHHVERPFTKRERERADPEVLAKTPRSSRVPGGDG